MEHIVQWSRRDPGLLILLIDQSATTSPDISSQIAAFANHLFKYAIMLHTVGTTVKTRLEIAVFAYSGKGITNPFLGGLAGKTFINLQELNDNPIRIEESSRKELDGTGQVIEIPYFNPIWLDPVTIGAARMCAALKTARELAAVWARIYHHRSPPILINLTGGFSSDGNPIPFARELTEVATDVGQTLLFNCQVSNASSGSRAIEFPDSRDLVPALGLSQSLYEMSSEIPEVLRKKYADWGAALSVHARGYSLNGNVDFIWWICSSFSPEP